MPEIFAVQSSQIDALLRRLEVRLIVPRAPLWELSNVIQPVSLVDSGITLPVDPSASPYLFATEGVKSVPAAGTLLADTGALPAGNYEFRFWFATNESVFIQFELQHRDAANGANNWRMNMATPVNQICNTLEFSESFLVNERLRCILSGGTPSASTVWTSIIWRRLLPT